MQVYIFTLLYTYPIWCLWDPSNPYFLYWSFSHIDFRFCRKKHKGENLLPFLILVASILSNVGNIMLTRLIMAKNNYLLYMGLFYRYIYI